MKIEQNVTFFRSKNCGGSCLTSSEDDTVKWLSECISKKEAEILIRDHNGKEIQRERISKKKKIKWIRATLDQIRHQKKNASELIDQVVNSIVFHFYADVETKQYLAEHGQNLDSDIADLTNNIVTVRFSAKEIHLSAITGSAITVKVEERMSTDHLQRLLKAALTLIFICLAWSHPAVCTFCMKIDVASAMYPTFFREIGKDDEFIQQIKECMTVDWFGLHSKAKDAICMKSVKVFTAFSGYDSQCMALERLKEKHPGFEYKLVGWSEIDQKAIASHNAAFPEFANCYMGDITQIDWSSVPDFDLFTYSSPCQSFSAAGKREGGDRGSGTKSSLLWECQRAIQAKRPKYCVFENVKGLVDKTMYHTFEEWQQTLCHMGYVNYWKVLDAHDYGLPQHRERLIMVSIRVDDWTEIPNYYFPGPFPCAIRPEDLLDDAADEKYYLSQDETDTFVDLLQNGNTPGYEVETSFRGRQKKRKDPTNSRLCKIFVTPTCRDGAVPTITASGVANVNTMYSTGDRPAPGVVEVRKKKIKINKK